MRVLLADDHGLFRAGIASLLRVWGMNVVGEAADGATAIAEARRLRPDLVLMDINMHGLDGLAATRSIKAELPETKVVIVTVSDESDDLFEAIKAGADGYLLKDMSEAELEHVLGALARHETALSPRIATRILEEFARMVHAGSAPPRDDALSGREREVLRLVAAGSTNREIAASLFISQNTVNFHVHNILAKLHMRNRAQAAAYAIHAGIAKAAADEATT
jgi:two-component system, NarL family, nitrate/nitrite response regulator NarL